MRTKIFKTLILFLFAVMMVTVFPAQARKKVPVKPKAEPVKVEEKAPVEVKNDVEPAPTVTEPSTPENKVIDSLLENGGFPAKSNYLKAEEEKNKDADVAQQPTALTPASPVIKAAGQDVPAPSYGRLFLGFLFIVALIAGLAMLWRKIESKAGSLLPKSLAGNNKSLRIVAQQPVNLKSKILVVEAFGKRYLVGATAENISLLADLDFFDSKSVEAVSAEASAETVPTAMEVPKFEMPVVADEPVSSHLNTVMEERPQVAKPEARGVFTPLVRETEPASFEAVLEQEQPNAPRVAERIREKLKSMKKISSTH